MGTTSTERVVFVGIDGLEGWTSCCEAAVTFSGETLCCKACWHEVGTVCLEGEQGEALSAIVRATIAGEITGSEGAARQRGIVAGG